MRSEINNLYGNKFKIKHASVISHSWGPIKGTQFLLEDTSEPPHRFYYYLEHSSKLEIDTTEFLAAYEEATSYRYHSIDLHNYMAKYYTNSISQSLKIQEDSLTYRWVHEIDTGRLLSEENKREEFNLADSIAIMKATDNANQDQFFNFYYGKINSNSKKSIVTSPHYFDRLKRNWHYRIFYKRKSDGTVIFNKDLFATISPSTIDDIFKILLDYIKLQPITYKDGSLIVSELTETDPKRDINFKGFMFMDNSGQKYFGKYILRHLKYP